MILFGGVDIVMGDLRERLLPGTTTTYFEKGQKGYAKIEMLLLATGGLNLSQVCSVTGLEGSTIQNWVKRGWVDNPKGKKYGEKHIARILIINALKECIKLEHIALLMSYVNAAGNEADKDYIKESELFNCLCDALEILGQADDLSRSGVEAVVEKVVSASDALTPGFRDRVGKALAVMIYACVCTDVKRRTEVMMSRVLGEMNHPGAGLYARANREAGTAAGDAPFIPADTAPADRAASQNAASSITAVSDSPTAKPAAPADKPAPQQIEQKPTGKPVSPAAFLLAGTGKQAAAATPQAPQAPQTSQAQQHVPTVAAAPQQGTPQQHNAATQQSEATQTAPQAPPEPEAYPSVQGAPRKTISQTLREWDNLKDTPSPADSADEEAKSASDPAAATTDENEQAATDNEDKPAYRPVYFGRS